MLHTLDWIKCKLKAAATHTVKKPRRESPLDCADPVSNQELLMGIPALLGEPDHLAEHGNKTWLFHLPNGSSFSTKSGFGNSAKFSNILTSNWYLCLNNNSLQFW